MVPLYLRLPAAGDRLPVLGRELVQLAEHRLAVLGELGRRRVEGAAQNRHDRTALSAIPVKSVTRTSSSIWPCPGSGVRAKDRTSRQQTSATARGSTGRNSPVAAPRSTISANTAWPVESTGPSAW